MLAEEFSASICALLMMKEISFRKTAKLQDIYMSADHGLPLVTSKVLAPIVSRMTVGLPRVMWRLFILAVTWKSRTARKTSLSLAENGSAQSRLKMQPAIIPMSTWQPVSA